MPRFSPQVAHPTWISAAGASEREVEDAAPSGGTDGADDAREDGPALPVAVAVEEVEVTAVAVAVLSPVGGPMPSPLMPAPTPLPTPAPTLLAGRTGDPTATSSLPAFSSMLAMQQPSSAVARHCRSLSSRRRRHAARPSSHTAVWRPAGVSPSSSPLTRPRTPAPKPTSKGRRRLSDNRNIANFCLHKEACHPIVGRAAGAGSSHVVDADGNWLLDLGGGFGAIAFGHNPPFVRNAVVGMMRRGEWAMGWAHALAARNAEKLCRLTGMERCAFVTTGSEATTLALRLCRLHTGRPRVVIFDGSYHGHFDAFLGYPADAAAPGQCAPVAPGIPEAYTRDLIVLPYDEEASLVYIEQHHREIACIFCEAIQNRNPAAVPADFLRRLRALTSERGIVLVFDEVVTGFRVAAGGVQERLGIRCDLAAM